MNASPGSSLDSSSSGLSALSPFFLKGSIHAWLAMFSGRSDDALHSFPCHIAVACYHVF